MDGATNRTRRRSLDNWNWLVLAAPCQDVLDVDHADRVVQRLAIDRQTGVAAAGHRIDDLGEAGLAFDGDDVGARHHHVFGGAVAQLEDVGEKGPLVVAEGSSLSSPASISSSRASRTRGVAVAVPARCGARPPRTTLPTRDRLWPRRSGVPEIAGLRHRRGGGRPC